MTGITIRASWEVRQDSLVVTWRLSNDAPFDAYVLDRLWMCPPGARELASDAEQAYRFILDGRLELVVGEAPLPEFRLIPVRNVPCATRVARAASIERRFEFSLPVHEYNVYQPAPDESHFEPLLAFSAALSVQIVPDEGVPVLPIAFEPPALLLNVPDVVERSFVVRSDTARLIVPAMRRTGRFSRP